jgi:hypothetical protein
VTSSVSGCRHYGSGCIVAGVTWAYACCALVGYLAVSCIYTYGPRHSRAVVGPSLGHVHGWVSVLKRGAAGSDAAPGLDLW